ncbi:MAG: hydantoinase B/oxoprolinase family protein [Acidimicrobiia bacterium]
MGKALDQEIDPFTFEIIRHKLFRVIDEGLITLGKVSGTAVTADGHDVLVALYLPDGSLLTCGLGFLEHLVPASRAVRQITSSFAEDPGIFDGDVFFANDPYTVSIHCPDIYMITPIFFNGELATWVVNFVHVTDIGGVDVGGFCPNAREVFHEGFSTKGLKIIERGTFRRDVYETFLNMVRDPGMTGLDLNSQMAANFVVKERMQGLYDEYGHNVVETVGKRLIDESEQRLRRRLLELPDGTWRAVKYLDVPDKTHRLVLAATKEGDQLTYDFTGTDPQTDFPVNCHYWHTKGEAMAPVLPLLAWDMTWNDGVLRCLDVVVPEGCLLNAVRPAPISLNTVSSGFAVKILSNAVLAKMLAASPAYSDRAVGCWTGSQAADVVGGVNRYGEFVAQVGTDVFAMPEGARSFADGAGSGGFVAHVALTMGNVETEEQAVPKRFLYRRVVPDSGGVGKFRGGPAHERAVVPHGGATDEMTAVVIPGTGEDAPGTPGTSGGYPGATSAHRIFRKSNVDQFPWNLEATTGEQVDDARATSLQVSSKDILYLRSEGGGGYGDPLDRDPELVLQDVLLQIVTAEAGRAAYGVIVDELARRVDVEATRTQRTKLREQRLGKSVDIPSLERQIVERTKYRINEYLQLTAEGTDVQCTWCGAIVGPASDPWTDHATRRTSPVALEGPPKTISSDFVLQEFFCPTCATCLEVQVTKADEAPLEDVISRWP